jgi:hypothetical protein
LRLLAMLKAHLCLWPDSFRRIPHFYEHAATRRLRVVLVKYVGDDTI